MAATVTVANPGAEHDEFSDEIDAALLRVARSGRYVLGPGLVAFESEFAAYVGVAHGVGTANGTDALELALRAVGCGPGTEVITAANAGGYAATAAQQVGATPVYVEVLADSLLADPDHVAASLGDRSAAVVVTHLFGHLHPRTAELRRICDRHGIPLIEDCAQSSGARSDGRHAGSFGTLAAHSFYPTKNLGALGDAGMVTTDDIELARRVRALRQYGWTATQRPEVEGGRNSRLDELQAAVLRVKLRHLDDLVLRRREVVRRYRSGTPDRWWAGEDGPNYSAHLAVTRSSDRDRFRKEADTVGIGTAVHFPTPDHLQPTFGAPPCRLPVTESACAEVVSLPCHASLTDGEIDRVLEFLATRGGAG